MKVSSVVPVVILVAEVALAIPAALEGSDQHGHVSELVLNDRGIPCFVEGNCGGIDSQLPGSDCGYPTQTSARSVCFPGIGRRAVRTLVTVASSVTSDGQADPESTPGTDGFMGPTLHDRETPCIAEDNCGGINTQQPSSSDPATSLPIHSSVTAIAPLGTTTLPLHSSVTAIAPAAITTVTNPAETCYEIADGQVQCVPAAKPKLMARAPKTATAFVTLDDRETPCIAEDNCGGINTQQPASSSPPPPPTTPLPPATTVSGAMTTTMGIALTPYSGQYGSLIAPPSPALSCWEADNGQVHCVPPASPSPASSVQTKKKYPILPRETGMLGEGL